VQSQNTSTHSSSCPKTGGLFLHLASYLITPTIQNMAMNFALKELSQKIMNQALGSSIQGVFSKIISMPFDYLRLKSTETHDDSSLDIRVNNYAKRGKEISTTDGFFTRISESNQTMMILLASVVSLYFQYIGMMSMKEDYPKYTAIDSHVDGKKLDDKPSASFIIKLKEDIYSKYKKSDFYYAPQDNKTSNLFDTKSLNIKEYNSVRLIYNTLVGLNHTLFFCLGGNSQDPIHEIIHWTKILVYWEILARLLKQNGLGPMQIASQMFVHDLWNVQSNKA